MNNIIHLMGANHTTVLTTLTDSDIIGGVKYDIDLNPDDDIMIGAVSAASIEFITNKETDNTEVDNWCYYVFYDDKVQMTNKYTHCGYFLIKEKYYIGHGKWKIVAYDAKILLEKDVSEFLGTLTYPLALQEYAGKIAHYCGLPVPDWGDDEYIMTLSTNPTYQVKENFEIKVFLDVKYLNG